MNKKQVFLNRIQPFEAANISAAFFLCRPMIKNISCHKLLNRFQDDISCALAMYSYVRLALGNINIFQGSEFQEAYNSNLFNKLPSLENRVILTHVSNET